jgi:validoxylamine A glucosyltransferase
VTSSKVGVSVVVPTYNRAALLRRTLHSLTEQTLDRAQFEVIVSDDGSSDDTARVVESFADRLSLRYRRQDDEGYRVALARNAGARMATAPLLAFLDSGVLAGPDFLAAHVTAHERTPGKVILGYTYGYQPFQPTEGLAEAVVTSSVTEIHDRFRDDPGFRDIRHDRLAPVDFDLDRLFVPWMFLWSMNFSVPAADYWAVGGFDERFITYGTEDVELGFRLVRHGLGMRMERAAWAIEQPHERDLDSLWASCRTTMRQFLAKFHEPEVELVWAVTAGRIPGTFENRQEEFLRGMEASRTVDVRKAIEYAPVNTTVPERTCIVGCGADVPDELRNAVLIDYDQDLLRRSGAPDRPRLHSIGLDLPFEDGSMEAVVLTPRLAGLEHCVIEAVRAEARRVGLVVHDLI